VVLLEPERIDIQDLERKLDRGEPVFFIDTRSAHAWEESGLKIPGAVRLHYRDIEAHLDELPRDRTIVTYCT
jgi:rhodanese-related sulfurtransferase